MLYGINPYASIEYGGYRNSSNTPVPGLPVQGVLTASFISFNNPQGTLSNQTIGLNTLESPNGPQTNG